MALPRQKATVLPRTSGILLHPTSLPGRYGIGDLGAEAYRFADFLASAGQSLWQVLPLGPTGYGNSPYMCFSAFAGNPLLISLDRLVKAGFLDPVDIEKPPSFPERRVAYARVTEYKMRLLRKSCQRFRTRFSGAYPSDYLAFVRQNAFWLEDYALFMALKVANQDRIWSAWDDCIGHREPNSLVEWRDRLCEETEFQKYIQYIFFEQWQSLRHHCQGNGIRIVGDMPIYVAYDSSDVWVNRDFFYLDHNGNPLVVAGVPPDYFSAIGQRWGNPIYRSLSHKPTTGKYIAFPSSLHWRAGGDAVPPV